VVYQTFCSDGGDSPAWVASLIFHFHPVILNENCPDLRFIRCEIPGRPIGAVSHNGPGRSYSSGFVSLQQKWEPLVEELIVQTSLIRRYEPRLIEGMAGWLQKHGDLVTSLMRKHIESGDPAVIGLLRYMSKAKGLSKELR